MEKPTLKSLSKILGLDPSLISRVLRGSQDARVSEENRKRILQAAQKAGYRPDRMARSLRARSSNVVALLTPDITNPFHSLFFRGAEAAARVAGFDVILGHLADVHQSEELVASVTQGLVDGVLVACAWQPDPRLKILREANMPYVVINRPSGDPNDLQFLPDDAAIGAIAAKALVDLGHKRIVGVFSDMRVGGMRMRRDAFVRKARELDPDCEVMVKEEVNSFADLRALMHELLTRSDMARPGALFFAHSQYAGVAVQEAVLRHKLKVPEDLSIIGCGTAPDSLVSSVCIPAETIGSDGMNALLGLIAGNPCASGTIYAPVLNQGATMTRSTQLGLREVQS